MSVVTKKILCLLCLLVVFFVVFIPWALWTVILPELTKILFFYPITCVFLVLSLLYSFGLVLVKLLSGVNIVTLMRYMELGSFSVLCMVMFFGFIILVYSEYMIGSLKIKATMLFFESFLLRGVVVPNYFCVRGSVVDLVGKEYMRAETKRKIFGTIKVSTPTRKFISMYETIMKIASGDENKDNAVNNIVENIYSDFKNFPLALSLLTSMLSIIFIKNGTYKKKDISNVLFSGFNLQNFIVVLFHKKVINSGDLIKTLSESNCYIGVCSVLALFKMQDYLVPGEFVNFVRTAVNCGKINSYIYNFLNLEDNSVTINNDVISSVCSSRFRSIGIHSGFLDYCTNNTGMSCDLVSMVFATKHCESCRSLYEVLDDICYLCLAARWKILERVLLGFITIA